MQLDWAREAPRPAPDSGWKLLPSKGKEAEQGHNVIQRTASGIPAPGCPAGLVQPALGDWRPSGPQRRPRELK